MPKKPHHAGTYHVDSAAIRDAANANPNTRCWRCGHTLTTIRKTKPNAIWTAGHLNDGQEGGPLLPECSPCNYSAGARAGNRRRTTTTRTTINW